MHIESTSQTIHQLIRQSIPQATRATRWLALAPALLAGHVALAQSAVDFYADVVAVTPVVERVQEVRKVVTTEVVADNSPSPSIGGMLLGGLAGGLIGNNFGHGSGRAAMVGIGTTVGAAMGGRAGAGSGASRSVDRVRDVVEVRDVVTGYRVTYRLDGRDSTVIMPQHPGSRVRVTQQVSMAPAPALAWNPVDASRY